MNKEHTARLSTVLKEIQSLRQGMQQRPDVSGQPALSRMLADLKRFATDGDAWLDARAALLERAPGKHRKRMLSRYPARYARNLVLTQTLHDLRVITHIWLQRGSDQWPREAATVAQLEALARHYLAQAARAGLISEMPEVLVYLQKTPSIRISPYANTVLIGVPLWVKGARAQGGATADLMAIAHEIGHYVYWRGTVPAPSGNGARYTIARLLKGFVQDTFQSGPETDAMPAHTNEAAMKRWSEEIFADVFACWCNGPASIVSLIDMIRDRNWKESMLDLHDAHPAPVLRPEAMIGLIADSKIKTGLHRYWSGLDLVKTAKASPQYKHLRAESKGVIQAFEQTTRFCFDLLPAGAPMTAPGNRAPDALAGGLLEASRTALLAALKRGQPKDVALPGVKAMPWARWIRFVADEYKALSLSYVADDAELLEWVCAISAGGWTEGPANGGNRPT